MNGVDFSKHSLDRMAQRGIRFNEALEMLSKASQVYPKNIYHSDITQCWKYKNYIFIIRVIGKIKKVLTVYFLEKYLFY